MQALRGESLLQAWDRGIDQHDLERALTLLALGSEGAGREELAALPIAERNLLLLQLRQLTFGPKLEGVTACEHCSEAMEISLPIAALIADINKQRGTDSIEWSEGELRLRMRAATTFDLLASLDAPQADVAEEIVLTRCMSTGDDSISCDLRSMASMPQIRARFDQLHQAAELRCVLNCPRCSGSAAVDLDIARFLWLEVRHAALRLMEEIHTLASHYGWSEMEIARMTPRRRAAYLELLQA